MVQNVPPIATLNAADAILLLAALGFLGYGIQPTQGAEWGYDINRAVSDSASGIWWTAIFPGLAISQLPAEDVVTVTLVGPGDDVISTVCDGGNTPPCMLKVSPGGLAASVVFCALAVSKQHTSASNRVPRQNKDFRVFTSASSNN